MMQTQSAIDPSLAALLQTAQMVTPDQTPTVAAQVAQAAVQKMQPQGIMQGMPQARQDYAAAAPSMMRNMQQAQVQQMMQQAMQPQPAGIEGLPAQNMQGMQRMAVGGVVGYAGKEGSYVDPQFPSVYENYVEPTREARTGREEDELFGPMKSERQRVIEAVAEELLGPMTKERLAAAPQRQTQQRSEAPPAPRPPAERPPAPVPAPRPSAQPAPTGVATLAAQPKMDLSRYEKAGAEDRAAMEKIIAAQEANAAAKAAYMSGRPKFEQEGIAALTKANQAREEMLAKERADDAYRRQQALLDQIGRRNLNAYSQEEARQRQRDLSAAEAQRLYEQAVIKQREAEFLQGAGRFEEAKKALDDKEKILSAMQVRINQSRQTEAGIAERQFAGAVQMRSDDMRAQTAAADRAAQAALRNLPSVEQQMAERVMKDYMTKNPGSTLSDAWDFYRGGRANAAEERNRIARQKLLADDPLYKLAKIQVDRETDPAKRAEAQRKVQEIERKAGIVDVAASAPTQVPSGVTVTKVGP